MAPKTTNSHKDAFRRFFDWAERHRNGADKLFVAMKVPKAKATPLDRRAFNLEQAGVEERLGMHGAVAALV